MQGTILTLIALFMRSTNLIYRSYLSGEIGALGMGLYQLIFSVFILAITLSTSGISLAVTRLVSSLIAKNERAKIRSTVFKCLAFCLMLSLVISSLFFFCADYIAVTFLKNINAAPSLRILGIGLPFMSLCTCVKGYFLAVDEGISCAIAELCEHVVTIGGAFVIFTLFPFENIETACMYAMIASTIGEICSFIIDMISMKFSLKRHTSKKKEKSNGVVKSLARIALPCTFSSAARSLLSTAENLLIPINLQKNGFTYAGAISEYGKLQGMALPILYFPSAFIWPFASLLIPKICKEREMKHKKAVAHITEKAVGTAVSFAIITSGVFFVFADLLAEVFYSNSEVSFYIRILAPLIPLMYLDIVVDCLLKGLDQQLNSMKYNIIDSCLRVGLIVAFMSVFGMNSYIVILFASMIFNASLSFGKVIKVTSMSFSFLKKLLYQIPLMLLSVGVATFMPQTENHSIQLGISIAVSYGIYGIICFVFEKDIKPSKRPY